MRALFETVWIVTFSAVDMCEISDHGLAGRHEQIEVVFGHFRRLLDQRPRGVFDRLLRTIAALDRFFVEAQQ